MRYLRLENQALATIVSRQSQRVDQDMIEALLRHRIIDLGPGMCAAQRGHDPRIEVERDQCEAEAERAA